MTDVETSPFDAPARTKIVATVGPASNSREQLRAMIVSGVDVFRLNMAHGELDDHLEVVKCLRALGAELEQVVGILVDLAGPKIRLGALASEPIECPSGGRFRLVRGLHATSPDELVTNYEGLLDDLKPGSHIALADGTVTMRVESCDSQAATLSVVQSGTIRSRQGVHVVGAALKLPGLTDADRRHARWAAEAGADFVGLSFVRSAGDITMLRSLLRKHGSTALVIAKIEKREALANLDSIVIAADGVMVARGDLGVEIDIAHVPSTQKQIIDLCNRRRRPVITATQMLDSMQHNRQPTRAEATDVANAILDGTDACMLSGETAIGEYPVEAVKMMNRIALAIEPRFRAQPAPLSPTRATGVLREVTAAMVGGAGMVARQLNARLIVVSTHTGATALALSKLRGHVPVVGVSDTEVTRRHMCLFWGVTPLPVTAGADADGLLAAVERWGRAVGQLSRGDRIVLLAGGSAPGSAGHNSLVVHEVA